ncbi:hypothetical protein SAMN05661080_05209 [Modestobacter sp. DSM 44400]|nr:hypothetical protein SAMN05661080_05209 [Modestobacter sp. DSM 44400]
MSGGCAAAGSYVPALTPGQAFSVCVTVTVRIPLLPAFVDATTATGQFVVERDRYVDGETSFIVADPVRLRRAAQLPSGEHRRRAREVGAAVAGQPAPSWRVPVSSVRPSTPR